MSCGAATYSYEKSHREQRRARRHHHKDENHGSPKILLLSAGTQHPLRRNQDCQPCRSEDTKGKGIPSRNYVRWKTHMVPQRKENGGSSSAPKITRCRASWPAIKSIKRAIRRRIKC